MSPVDPEVPLDGAVVPELEPVSPVDPLVPVELPTPVEVPDPVLPVELPEPVLLVSPVDELPLPEVSPVPASAVLLLGLVGPLRPCAFERPASEPLVPWSLEVPDDCPDVDPP